MNESDDIPPIEQAFNQHAEVRECPRCTAETWGRPECPACGLVLDDATLESYATRVAQGKRTQLLALAAIGIALFAGFGGIAFGYALGKRSVVVERAATMAVRAEETATVFRALPRRVRFQLHATQLQVLYAPAVLTPGAIRFSPVTVPAQEKPRNTDDLTFVARSDSGWRQLSSEERQLLLVALVRKHQAFLGLAGADSTACAVVLAARQADGTERILAMRDRRGQLFLR